MNSKEDITGHRFHRLSVIRETKEKNSHNEILWECKCDCGNTILAPKYKLKTGWTKSCGCLHKELFSGYRGVRNYNEDGTNTYLLDSSKMHKNNTSGYKGVVRHNLGWIAQIKYKYQHYYLCYSNNIDECVAIRKEAEDAIKKGEFDDFILRLKAK